MDPVVLWPNKSLSSPALLVQVFGKELQELVDRMQATKLWHHGRGLAANQIKVPWRVALVGDGRQPLVMVNPKLLSSSGNVLRAEGCLSVPGFEEQVRRFEEVAVSFQDLDGKLHSEVFSGEQAHIVQHELDHLDGLVYLDRLGPARKGLIRRQLEDRRLARARR